MRLSCAALAQNPTAGRPSEGATAELRAAAERPCHGLPIVGPRPSRRQILWG
jgi:hypothetical protein